MLIGDDPPVTLTDRARKVLADLRASELGTVRPGGTVVTRAGPTCTGGPGPGSAPTPPLAATLSEICDGTHRFDDA
ncbi:MAG: hypothetical protein H7Y15_11410 [Pseudonocardia sp.]|nr:hypothetical protein [Pseudonocardia sp.]